MSQPAPGGCRPFHLRWWAVMLLTCILLSLFLTILGLRPGRIINELNGVVAIAPLDVWAVGYSATFTGFIPLVEHYTGRWRVVSSPGRDDASYLEGVAASSSHDVWAVGESYQSSSSETLIEHWDGASWQIVPSPNDPGANSLSSVAVISPTDAWAVGATDPCPPLRAEVAPTRLGNALARARPSGDAAECPGEHPLLEHWNGRAWSIATSPSPDSKFRNTWLDQVTAFAWNDVWALGPFSNLFEHWDGSSWKVIPAPGSSPQDYSQAVALSSDNDIWAAGFRTFAQQYDQPVMNHWNGSAWSEVVGPPYSVGAYIVGTMTASAADDVWVLGNQEPPGQIGYHDAVFAMHWNGRDWKLVSTPSPGGGFIQINGSASLSARDAWMVGHFYAWNDDQYGLIEHWNGQGWNIIPSQDPGLPWGIFNSTTP